MPAETEQKSFNASAGAKDHAAGMWFFNRAWPCSFLQIAGEQLASGENRLYCSRSMRRPSFL